MSPDETTRFLATFPLAVGFALVASIAIKYLADKRRSKHRPIGWTCERCGKRYDTTATSKSETIFILYGALAVHATAAHPPSQERPGEPELTFEFRTPPAWRTGT